MVIKHRTAFLVFIVMVFSSSLFADGPIIPLNPEEPWPNDPNLTFVDDQVLLQLWEDTVMFYRRKDSDQDFRTERLYRVEKYTSIPKTKETQEYLIASLSQSLQANPVNLDKVRLTIILMYAGMDTDPRIPALAEQFFKMPRPMKMSDDYRLAHYEMFRLLRTQQSAEATALIAAATYREFWGDSPFHVRLTGKDSEKAIFTMRELALYTLVDNMPPDLAIPYVEEMLAAYPEPTQEPSKTDDGTMSSKTAVHDFIQPQLENCLDRLHAKREEKSATTSDAAEQ